eukprot:UN06250
MMHPTVSKEYLSQDFVRNAEALFVDGYIHSEAIRISGMSSNCGHFRFKNQRHPSKYFADFLFDFMEKVEHANNTSKYGYADSFNTITDIAGDGICQVCASFLLIRLLNHQKERNSTSFYPGNQIDILGFKDYLHICSTLNQIIPPTNEKLISHTNTGYSCSLSMLCIVIMAHPHICKYAFKYSDFWCNCFATFTCMISLSCQLLDSDPKKNINVILTINSLFCFGLQLIRNIHLVKKKQWKW